MKIKSPPRSAVRALRETLHSWSEKEIQTAGLILLIQEVTFAYAKGYSSRTVARIAAREAARLQPDRKFVVRRNEVPGFPWKVSSK